MPKGKGFKKNKGPIIEVKMVEKDVEREEYALVTKKLGNGHFMLKLNMRSTEIIGRLCGKMRKGNTKKQNWVDIDSVVLVGFRDFQDNIVDIVHVYDAQEVRQLRKSGAFVEESNRPPTEKVEEQDEDCAFDFDEI